jgi:hypothetical protein
VDWSAVSDEGLVHYAVQVLIVSAVCTPSYGWRVIQAQDPSYANDDDVDRRKKAERARQQAREALVPALGGLEHTGLAPLARAIRSRPTLAGLRMGSAEIQSFGINVRPDARQYLLWQMIQALSDRVYGRTRAADHSAGRAWMGTQAQAQAQAQQAQA